MNNLWIVFVIMLIQVTTVFAGPVSVQPVNYEKVKSLRGFTGEVLSAAFSPDNKYLATGLSNNRVIIWDVKSWNSVITLEKNENDVTAVAFSSDGKFFASGDSQKKIYVWNTSNWSKVGYVKAKDKVNALQFSNDNTKLAVAAENKNGLLYDIKEDDLLLKLKGHDDDITSISYSHDQKMLITSSRDNRVMTWDAVTGKNISKILNHKDSIYDMIVSDNGKYIISAGNDNAVNITDLKTGQYVDSLVEHLTSICKLANIPGTDLVVSADCVNVSGPFGIRLTNSRDDCKIIVWDLATRKLVKKIDSTCDLTALAVSPDGKYIVAGYSLGAKDLVLFERK